MKMYPGFLLVLMYVTSVGAQMDFGSSGSLIFAQAFPKTYEDLSFMDRIAVEAEGYDDVGTEYDENGVCVSGCAYVGMTLEEEERMIQRASEELQQLIEIENIKRGYDPAKQQQQQQQQQQFPQVAGQMQPVSGQQQPSQTQQNTQSQSIAQDTQASAQQNTTGGGAQLVFGPPVKGDVKVGSDFGERRPPTTKGGKKGSKYHRGLDIKAGLGTPLYAASDGKVVKAQKSSGYGNVVEIEHSFTASNKKAKTVYAHMNSIEVKVGTNVTKGQRIGTAGNTGNSGGPHLHYELRFDDIRVDPLGSKIAPILDKHVGIASSTRGTNYLGAPYCIKQGISSKRLQKFRGNDAALRENFPQCTGWCTRY